MRATRRSVVLCKEKEVMASKLSMVKEDRDRIARKYEDLVGKLRDKVECPVCLELPRQSPVHVCPNGHVVCAECVRTKCPTCRTYMVGRVISTSLLAVTVIENIDHKCNYCDLYFNLKDFDQHQSKCKHRPVKCPEVKCGAMVSLPKLKDHLVSGCAKVKVVEINEETMPCIFCYKWDTFPLNRCVDSVKSSGRDFHLSLRAMCFDKKLFFLKTTLRQTQGRVRWILYVQMAGNIEETSMFGVNIVVFRDGDSPGEGKYCQKYSGDVCHIDTTSVDEVERQGCCLSIMDGAMTKMSVKDSSGTQNVFRVWINIYKNL